MLLRSSNNLKSGVLMELNRKLQLCMLGNLVCFCRQLIFNYLKTRRTVRPDLGPNCLQTLSADDKGRLWQVHVMSYIQCRCCKQQIRLDFYVLFPDARHRELFNIQIMAFVYLAKKRPQVKKPRMGIATREISFNTQNRLFEDINCNI